MSTEGVYSRDMGRGNSRAGGSDCTVGTWVGARVACVCGGELSQRLFSLRRALPPPSLPFPVRVPHRTNESAALSRFTPPPFRRRYTTISIMLATLASWLALTFAPYACGSAPRPRLPPPRTQWTRRVPHPVLIGHAASLSQLGDFRNQGRARRLCDQEAPRRVDAPHQVRPRPTVAPTAPPYCSLP